jgi:hypothetical protein
MAGKRKWTKGACRKIAITFSTKTEWAKMHENSYRAALRSPWFDEITSHMNGNKTWNQDACHDEAKKYNTRTEWQTNSVCSYQAAWKNEWLEICCSHMQEKAFDVIRYLKTAGKKVGRESSKNQAQ